MSSKAEIQRTIGPFGATCIGVGAIVGGGILALAGTAFEETGAGALLAFTINGLIALATALSFAELSTAFPRSGGSYVFAKRVLTIGSAFAVGWVVWFASMVAAVLYALGFAAFALATASELLGPGTPGWMLEPGAASAIAVTTTIVCALYLSRVSSGSGNLVNVAKVVLLAVLIGGGLWVWAGRGAPVAGTMTPFLPHGLGGLLRATGYTFIALQGFDLIAAVAGEVREPRKTLPRAMILALLIALAAYLPLLFVVLVVGVPEGASIGSLAAEHRETVLAVAARNYLGPAGFWLVLLTGLLSMLSALLANIYAATRIAQAMARDHTLPAKVAQVHPQLGTPVVALLLTVLIALATLLAIGDVASAGAAASLIFLLSFALVNVLCVVARKRKPRHGGFRVPLWPGLPIAGAVACISLAGFQSVVVPAAGMVAGGWLVAGIGCYVALFARRARVHDAVDEVVDADLLELRGRSPLVLVPTDRTTDPGVLALFAACISPPRVGRVLLLNIVPPLQSQVPEEFTEALVHAASSLRHALSAAVHAGARAEALATVGRDRWDEIERVSRTHRCASVLLGMRELADSELRGSLEQLVSRLTCNVVLFRVPTGWRPETVRRVLVPIRGSGLHSQLRARLLASLRHRAAPEMDVVYLIVLPTTATEAERVRRERAYRDHVRTEAALPALVRSVRSDDVGAAIIEAAARTDLLILGLSRIGRARRVFGEVTRKIIANTECSTLVISER